MRTHPYRRALSMLVVVALSALGIAAVSGTPETRVAAAATEPPSTDAAVADNRLVVGLESAATPGDAIAIAQDAGVTGAQVVDDQTIVVDAPPGGVHAAQADELRDDSRVKYVEPNYLISSSFTPNDPSFPALGTLLDAQPGGVRAESSWNTTLGSRDIVVGVLDSGIDATHPDLVANLWTNRTGIGGCAYGTHGYNTLTKQCTSSDQYGHGTHVAGILGAVGNNGIGITGVAPRVSLMSLAMLNQNGDGSIAGAIAAIDWAVKAKNRGVGIRVLSASWGGNGDSQGLTDAIRRAGAAGILFVAAAGNDGLNIDQRPVYPCAVGLPNVVCVAASRSNDQLAGFSDYGTSHVDLAAPGENIVSTVPRGVVPGCGQSLYCALDGTSMAAPMVSGAAVLAIAADPTVSVSALRARLVAAVDPVGRLANKVVSGGRLDVCKAVAGCAAVVPPTPPRVPSPPTAVRVAVVHGQATVKWSVPSSNGNGTGVTGYTVDGPSGTQLVGPGVRSIVVPGLVDNKNATLAVRAYNGAGGSLPAQDVGRSLSGGLVVHQNGRLARVRVSTGPKISLTTATELTAGQGQARGVALLPDGTGGYVLDAFGGLHPFGIGGNPLPPAATGSRVSKATDWARGVALMPDGTAGYVLDKSGKMFGFSIGDNVRPPATHGGPAFSGDLARGVTIMPSGTGGYVVDRSGTISRFAIGGGSLPPRAAGGPAWPGQDMVRGIALIRPGGGGFVLDRFGGLRPFRTDGAAPAAPVSGPSWPGVDRARGVAF